MFNWILIFAISAGQLVKFPSSGSAGATILDLVVIALFIFGISRFKSFKKPSKIFLSIQVFIFICILSLSLTPLTLTMQEYIQSFVYTIRFSLYFFVGYLIYCQILKVNLEKIILKSALIISSLGIAQLIFLPDLKELSTFGWDPHFFRTVSTFLDPNFLGAFLTLPLLLLFTKNSFTKEKIFLFVLIFLALLTTFSRSSYLVFLTSGITLSFLKRSIKLLIIVIVLFCTLLTGFQLYTLAVSKPRNIDRGYSANARLNTWQQGINIFEHAPILGVGFNTYRYSLREYNLAGNDFTNTRGASSNDASLLNILVTTGVIGFLSYITFLIFFLKLAFKLKNTFGLLGVSFVIGLLVHSIFNNSLFYPSILFLIAAISGKISQAKDSNS